MTEQHPQMGWQSVRDEALRRIRAREWPAGGRIPDEADLAAELGCARATVNRALRDLADAGLLDRRRRGGTHVSLTPVRKATFSIAIIRKDIEARGQVPGYRLLSDAVAATPAAVRAAFGPAGGTVTDQGTPDRMRRVVALHLADGRPFCHEDRWLNPGIVPDTVSFATLSANEWLVQNVSFSGGTLSFHAVSADPMLATRLGCTEGAALMALDRTTRTDQPITCVQLVYALGHRVETAL